MSPEMSWFFQMRFVKMLETLGGGRKGRWKKINLVVYYCKENNKHMKTQLFICSSNEDSEGRKKDYSNPNYSFNSVLAVKN